jgi:hypothetical protein
MIDERLILAVARDLGNVAIGTQAARVIAADCTVLLDALARERERLRFEDGPHDLARALHDHARARD